MCLGNLEGAKSKTVDEKQTESIILEVSPLQLTTSLQSLHHGRLSIV